MPLADSLKQEVSKYTKGKHYCAAVKFVHTADISKEDVKAYETILNNSDQFSDDYLPSTRLAALVRSEGYRVSASSIERHRAQDCPCHRVVG